MDEDPTPSNLGTFSEESIRLPQQSVGDAGVEDGVPSSLDDFRDALIHVLQVREALFLCALTETSLKYLLRTYG
jgi:hypothetical protein